MGALIQAFCATCRRTAYVRDDAEMACPVCSSPLLDVVPEDETGTG